MRHMMLEKMNVWLTVKQMMNVAGSHMTLMDGFA